MKRKRRAAAAAAATSEAAEAEAASSAALPRVRKRKRRRGAAAAAPAEVPAEDEVEDETADDEEAEEEEEAGDGGGDEPLPEFDMEFEFVEPDEADFHAVKDILRTTGTWEFVGESLNFSELTDSVVGQGNIGTIIKSSGESEDPTSCGLLTTLNLRQFASLSWPKAIQKGMLVQAEKHAGHEVSRSLKDLFGRQGKGTEVGLLFSERMVNLPDELVPPLHKALKEDIEWSCTTPDCPKEERPFYFFTHFIGVAKSFLSPATAAAAGHEVAGSEGPFLQLSEFEAYVKKASWVFSFPTTASTAKAESRKKKSGGGPPAPDGRTIFMITRKALDQVVKELNRAST